MKETRRVKTFKQKLKNLIDKLATTEGWSLMGKQCSASKLINQCSKTKIQRLCDTIDILEANLTNLEIDCKKLIKEVEELILKNEELLKKA